MMLHRCSDLRQPLASDAEATDTGTTQAASKSTGRTDQAREAASWMARANAMELGLGEANTEGNSWKGRPQAHRRARPRSKAHLTRVTV
jgi:hypothetical protein